MNPNKGARPLARTAPSAPPEGNPSAAPRLWKRMDSSAVLDASTTAKPTSEMASVLRFRISHASTRRYMRRIPKSARPTHHHAESPKR